MLCPPPVRGSFFEIVVNCTTEQLQEQAKVTVSSRSPVWLLKEKLAFTMNGWAVFRNGTENAVRIFPPHYAPINRNNLKLQFTNFELNDDDPLSKQGICDTAEVVALVDGECIQKAVLSPWHHGKLNNVKVCQPLS